MKNKILVGWQEWCSMPYLGVKYIKAKVDTGAKTSALHAFNIKEFIKNQKKYISFEIHPLQNNDHIRIKAEAEVIDERYITSSNGHKEKRYVISTELNLGDEKYNIELTLTNRDALRFRMLLGRDALKRHCIVDPSKKNCITKYPRGYIRKYYENIF